MVLLLQLEGRRLTETVRGTSHKDTTMVGLGRMKKKKKETTRALKPLGCSEYESISA